VSLRTNEGPAIPRGPITVIGAAYGAVSTVDPTAGARDVTATVQSLLDTNPEKQVTFTPSNALFGDPFPGPRKNFGITYVTTDGLDQRTSIASDENQKVTLTVT